MKQEENDIYRAMSFSCSGTGGAYPAGGTALVEEELADIATV